jgi:hypothetical protein
MAKKKIDKRTKAYKQSLKLGDAVEKVTEATGIKKAVHLIFGEDCGCDERKEWLNNLPEHIKELKNKIHTAFRGRKVNCLTQEEFYVLDRWFEVKRNTVSASQQQIFLNIHNRLFYLKNKPTTCASCVRNMMRDLERVHHEYKLKLNEENKTD